MSGRFLLAAGAVLLALLGAWAGLTHVERAGYDRGYAAAREASQQTDLDELRSVIASTKGLTEAAHAASQKLGQTISARQQADAQTTKEFKNALAVTASQRAGCVFDDDSMRRIDAAAERAAEAAARGVLGAVRSTP